MNNQAASWMVFGAMARVSPEYPAWFAERVAAHGDASRDSVCKFQGGELVAVYGDLATAEVVSFVSIDVMGESAAAPARLLIPTDELAINVSDFTLKSN